MTRPYVAYYRVSTARQGTSGLGLEAQRTAVEAYLGSVHGKLVNEYTEVETGKGANALDRRPKLNEALSECRRLGAVLIIAKLDRLARNVAFVAGLLETGCDFVAADMPQANKVMIQMHAVMSEWERDQISSRTKAALCAARARGVILGATAVANLAPHLTERRQQADAFARKHQKLIEGFRAAGMSERGIAAQLNDLGLNTARGGRWTQVQVQRLIQRLYRSLPTEVSQG